MQNTKPPGRLTVSRKRPQIFRVSPLDITCHPDVVLAFPGWGVKAQRNRNGIILEMSSASGKMQVFK